MREREFWALPLSPRNLLRAISESPIGGPFPMIGKIGPGYTVEVGEQKIQVFLNERQIPQAGRRVIVYKKGETPSR